MKDEMGRRVPESPKISANVIENEGKGEASAITVNINVFLEAVSGSFLSE